MQSGDREMVGVAAAFVSVAGIVWCVLALIAVAAGVGLGPGLLPEAVRVGGPPAVVSLAAAAVSLWARRRPRGSRRGSRHYNN